MLQPLQLDDVSTRYAGEIAELRDFLQKSGLDIESVSTFRGLVSRLSHDQSFHRDLVSHIWVLLDGGDRPMSHADLLGVVALAAAGKRYATLAGEYDAHDLLRFLMEARRTLNSPGSEGSAARTQGPQAATPVQPPPEARASGSMVSESIASGPIVSGPIATGPVASDPVVSSPVATEPIASAAMPCATVAPEPQRAPEVPVPAASESAQPDATSSPEPLPASRHVEANFADPPLAQASLPHAAPPPEAIPASSPQPEQPSDLPLSQAAHPLVAEPASAQELSPAAAHEVSDAAGTHTAEGSFRKVDLPTAAPPAAEPRLPHRRSSEPLRADPGVLRASDSRIAASTVRGPDPATLNADAVVPDALEPDALDPEDPDDDEPTLEAPGWRGYAAAAVLLLLAVSFGFWKYHHAAPVATPHAPVPSVSQPVEPVPIEPVPLNSAPPVADTPPAMARQRGAVGTGLHRSTAEARPQPSSTFSPTAPATQPPAEIVREAPSQPAATAPSADQRSSIAQPQRRPTGPAAPQTVPAAVLSQRLGARTVPAYAAADQANTNIATGRPYPHLLRRTNTASAANNAALAARAESPGASAGNRGPAQSAGTVTPTALGIMAGNLLYNPAPAYPRAASAARVQGEVRVQAEIDRDGNVTYARIVSGPPMLRDAALDAVQRWRYTPYLSHGKAVPMSTLAVVDFQLP